LALVLNGGYTVRDSGDGSTSTAPSAFGSLTYNYGPLDTISLIAAESLSSASIGITRSFSAQESSSVALQVNHRFTTGLHTALAATYVYSTFTSEVLGQNLVPQNVTPSDQAITAHVGIGYYFQKWLDVELRYDYTKLLSSNVELVQPYSRDQIGVNLTLTY
jgi:predicted porin